MSTSSDDPADAISDAFSDGRSGTHPLPPPEVPVGARPGDLTPRWRFVLAAAWVVAFFAYAAVWQASVQIGVATWWIGPRAQPTNMVVRLLPSLLSITLAMCAVYNVPRLLRLSALGVSLAAVGAIPDLSRSTGLGVTELVIAGLLGLVTVAALTGRYRLVPVPADDGAYPAVEPQRDTADVAAGAGFAPPDPDGP